MLNKSAWKHKRSICDGKPPKPLLFPRTVSRDHNPRLPTIEQRQANYPWAARAKLDETCQIYTNSISHIVSQHFGTDEGLTIGFVGHEQIGRCCFDRSTAVLVPLGILTTQTWQTSVFKAMAIFFCMLLLMILACTCLP